MRAVVYTEYGSVELQERPTPVPGQGEVLLRPLAVGICGTDLHPETFAFDPGVVMGHELSAVVVGLGPGASAFAAGERVVVNPNGITCGVCGACRSGRANLCGPAHEASIGIHRDGGLADHVAIPERALHRIPGTLSDERAAWAEPLAAVLHAVGAAGSIPGARSLVLGGGPMGLLALQVLRTAGATSVELVEPVPFRRAMADRLGATATFPSAVDLATGEPPTLILDCSGAPGALADAVHLVAPGGTVVVIGIGPAGRGILPIELVGKEVTLRGSALYVDEFPAAIDMLDGHSVVVDDLITGMEPLERFTPAFAAMRQPDRAVKFLLRP